MAKRIFFLFLAAVMLFAACRPAKPEIESWPVVSQINVTYQHNGSTGQRTYTTPSKMRQILNRLRTLGQQFTPSIDPETLTEQAYTIHIRFTDGSSREYQIKSDRYIRSGGQPWQQADPERIQKLNQLLQTLPEDAVRQ